MALVRFISLTKIIHGLPFVIISSSFIKCITVSITKPSQVINVRTIILPLSPPFFKKLIEVLAQNLMYFNISSVNHKPPKPELQPSNLISEESEAVEFRELFGSFQAS